MSKVISMIRRIKALEARKADKKLAVPDNWQDFARLTTIRSGNGFVPFDPYQYQLDLESHINSHETTVVTKTRQLGISEMVVNLFIYWCLRSPGFQALVFSKDQNSTSLLAKRARLAIEGLPTGMTCLQTDSLQHLEFSNGSSLLFRNSTINGSRGLASVNAMFYDEASFVFEVGQLYESSMPCTSMVDDPKIIIVSTPNSSSTEEWYFRMLSKDNGLNILEMADKVANGILPNQYFTDETGIGKAILHWRSHPKYGSNSNYLQTVRGKFKLPEDVVQREYNLSFSHAADSIFSPVTVAEITQGTLSRAKPKRSQEAVYIAVDPCFSGANSKKSDYFAVTVIGVDREGTMRLIDLYANRTKQVSEHVLSVAGLIEKYEPECVAIEINSGGAYVLENLKAMADCNFLEITSTKSRKIAMVQNLMFAIERGNLKLADHQLLIKQLLSFARSGDRYEALPGSHDDLVSALYLNIQNIRQNPPMFAQSYAEDTTELDINKYITNN